MVEFEDPEEQVNILQNKYICVVHPVGKEQWFDDDDDEDDDGSSRWLQEFLLIG